MDERRREILGRIGATTLFGTTLGAGLLAPAAALAAWNGQAFDARSLPEALKASGVAAPVNSREIEIKAPELSENAAFVPVEVTSGIAATEAILVFVEKNPWPYIARFAFSNGALPRLAMRLRLAESSRVQVVVPAGGKLFTATRTVSVTVGGCSQTDAVAAAPAPLSKPEATKIRVRLRDGVAEVRILMRHPMENGLRKTSDGRTVPEHFIRDVDVLVNGRPAIEAEFGRSVSADPLLTFWVKDVKANARVVVRWRDSKGLERMDETGVVPA